MGHQVAILTIGYNFSIEHRKGPQSILAYALSRAHEAYTDISAIEFENVPAIELDSHAKYPTLSLNPAILNGKLESS